MRAKFSFQGKESVVDLEITPQTADFTYPVVFDKTYADTESDTVEMSIVGCLQYDKTRKKILVSGLKSNGATLNDQHNFSQLTDSIYNGIGEAFSSVRISHHKTPTSFEVLPPVEGEVGENLYNFLDNKTFNTCSYVTITGEIASSGGDVDLDDFDYAVIRYSWTSSDGTDLDTRTYIETPDRKENTVGWDRMVTDSTYLSWNDDNREDGVESVLLNMADIKRDFSSHDKIVVSINAFWYAAVLEGNVKVSFETYKGGRMVASGYDWINVGGVSVQTAFVLTNTRNDTSVSSNDGDRLATFQYDFATGKSKLINNKPASDDSADDEYNPITCRKSEASYTVQVSPPESMEAVSYKVNDGVTQVLRASDLGLPSLTTDELLMLTYNSDQTAIAFIDQTVAGMPPEMTGGSSSQSATFYLSGISGDTVSFNGVEYGLQSHMGGKIHIKQELYPFTTQPEVTKLQILPTPSVDPANDVYYKFAGSESGEPLTFYSCQSLVVGSAINPPNTLKWSTRNIAVPSKKMKGTITLNGLRGEWQLLGGDTVLASNVSTGDVGHHTIQLTDWFTHEPIFEFIGTAGRVDINLPNGFAGINPIGEVNIESFSTTVAHQTINAPASILTVPETLPPNITSTSDMFKHCSEFNQDISMWDTSNVTNMRCMFDGASSFNQDLSSWDVGQVTDMYSMFSGATSFNGNISTWDVSNVTDMVSMFENAIKFNQNLSNWRVENVSTIRWMFDGASAFNAPINGWNLTSVGSMEGMFANAVSFNQPINDWNISTATTLKEMFNGASAFNQPLDLWDVSNITKPSYMASMFKGASSFNQDLSMWNVVNIASKPSWFDDGADAWVLPRPVWGTAGTALPVEPVVNGDTFEFTVISADTVDGNKPLTIHLGEGDSDWQLLADGEVIASATFAAEGVVVDDEFWNRRSITLSQLRGRTVNYSLAIASSHVALGNSNDTIQLGQRSIKVTKFSNTTGRCEFALPNIELTVPNTIPSTFTSLKNMFEYCNLFNDPSVSDWDTSNITTMVNVFGLCKSFNQNLSRWSTHNVTDMTSLFSNCQSFNQDINNWSVSNVENMERLFFGCQSYNQPLDNWNTSLVTKMVETFRGCTVFNQDLSTWNVSNVNSFAFCFTGASAFNGNIASWDVSGARNMGYMFQNAKAFNQDLSKWNVVNIARKPSYFDEGASSWTLPKPIWGTEGVQPINYIPNALNMSFVSNSDDDRVLNLYIRHDGTESWYVQDVANDKLIANSDGFKADGVQLEFPVNQANKAIVRISHTDKIERHYSVVGNMTKIFVEHYSVKGSDSVGSGLPSEASLTIHDYSPNIAAYGFSTGYADLIVPNELASHITDLSYMFFHCWLFDQDLSSWDVSNVTDMSFMFKFATSFNQDLSSWNTSRVSSMESMFESAIAFNGNVTTWDVSKVTSTAFMFFSNVNFNQDLSGWDTSNVTYMKSMFNGATSFNQDLSGWNVTKIPVKPDRFDYLAESWTLPKPVWGTNGVGNV